MDDALSRARRFRVRWPWELVALSGAWHPAPGGLDDTDPASRRAMKRRENKLVKGFVRRLDLRKLAA